MGGSKESVPRPAIAKKRRPGRPEKPVANPNRAVGQLARCLQEERARKGLTYAQLASHTADSTTALQRADSGTTVPSLHLALAYARACGLSPGEVRRLWQEARREDCRSKRRTRTGPAPRLELVREPAELSAALVDRWERNGAPPVRTMEARAEAGGISRSSAHRIVSQQMIPRSHQQLQAFLASCEVPESEWPAWTGAWNRAWQHRERERERLRQPSLAEREAEVAPDGRFTPRSAVLTLKWEGFEPLERFRGFGLSWTCRCMDCASVQRIRLSELLFSQESCGVCARQRDPQQ